MNPKEIEKKVQNAPTEIIEEAQNKIQMDVEMNIAVEDEAMSDSNPKSDLALHIG